MTPMIFVFGSNLAGRHGKGAALYARQHHGAIYGVGVGPQGSSYAIPTKGHKLEVLPIEAIKAHVDDFLEYARQNPQLQFQVTAIGCGLAGYKPAQIAPLFLLAPSNCHLPDEFRHALESASLAAVKSNSSYRVPAIARAREAIARQSNTSTAAVKRRPS